MYKLKDIFDSKNIKSFIEGNSRYFWDKWMGSPAHIKEQVKYRLSKCENDCLPNNACIQCGCPPRKKAFATRSCNPDRFPNLMNNEQWKQFKRENKI